MHTLRRHSFIYFFVCVVIVNSSSALEQIAGDLPKNVSVEKSPYLVISDIFVPAGKTVTIEAGTVFLFKNFTGLHVQGVVSANGTGGRPVVFTSENDPEYNNAANLNPTPFDWNGIYIHKDGFASVLNNIRISYSVNGLISDTKFFQISGSKFSNNGKTDISIEGKESMVQDSLYSYSLSIKDAKIDGVPVRILRDPDANKRNILRYIGLAVFVGGGAAGVVCYNEYTKSQRNLDALSSKEKANLVFGSNEVWNNAQKRRNQNIALTAGSVLVSLIGAAGFGWSFTF